MNIPEDLLFATSHEWLRQDSADTNTAIIGISDHAQHELTDVVYVELPEIGSRVDAGQQVCVVESVKAASDIYAPASGTIQAVNQVLASDPSLINTDPYGAGWIFKLSLSNTSELQSLKTPKQYAEQIG